MTVKHVLIAGIGMIPFLYAVSAKAEYGPCREYSKTISIGGRLEVGYGRACRQPDGAWEVMGLSAGNEDSRRVVGEYIRDDLYARGERRVIFIDRPVAVYEEPETYYYVSRPRYYYPARPVFYGKPWREDRRWHGHDDDHHDGRHRGRGHGHGHDRH